MEATQSKLLVLSNLTSEVGKTIANHESRHFLLQPALNCLSDAEYALSLGTKADSPEQASMWFKMADFQLRSAEIQLKHIHNMIAKYGVNLQIIGG